MHEALLELEKEGGIRGHTKGSYMLVEQKGPCTGVVKRSSKSGVEVETEDGKELFVDKKDGLFSLAGDEVEVVLLKSKKTRAHGFITKVLKRKKDSSFFNL